MTLLQDIHSLFSSVFLQKYKLQEELEQILEQNGDGLMMNAAGMQTQLKDGTI
jgi:hypothetical protein